MSIDVTPRWQDEELSMFRDNVGRFLEAELAPHDEQARKEGNVGHAMWRKVGEMSLLCTDIPEQYGGAGGDFRHEAVVAEEMGKRGLTGLNHSVHSIVAHYFLNHGTDEQKEKYLPRMARGELVGAIAMTEPGTGSDLQSIGTHAKKDGDHYVINGSKTFISNGFLAGVVLVCVKTDTSKGAKGISIMVVETENQQGFKVGRVLDKIGLKAQDTAELFFEDVRVHESQLLGSVEGKGFAQLMGDLPYERLFIGVSALAAMEGAYHATLDYVRERTAFGQPIADFQNTKFKLADIATTLKVGRAFVDECVEDMREGKLDTAKASMAKLWGSENQCRVIDECLQLFGGYGYMNEYMIGRMYTDARIQRIYGGTNEIMKEVISRSL